jgi:uncharacterized repeat protein (TIGR01451 family)
MHRTVVSGAWFFAAAAVSISAAFAGAPPAPPTLTKAFGPTVIDDGDTTVLTFTVQNTLGAPPLANVGFVDTLPAGIVVANPPAVGGTCANAAAATTATPGTATITVTGLDVPAGDAACTVTVNVTNAAGQTNESCGANPAAFTNDSGNVSVTSVVNGVQPSCLVVHSTAPPPPPPVVPALSPPMLGFLAVLVAGVGWHLARRFTG